jgi:catechol 2,3-dioxygenase-like lactoylglutathione lyase family enzyme
VSEPVSHPRTLGHVGITVTDLDRAVAWYRDVLGFDLLSGPSVLRGDDSHAGKGASDVFGSRFGEVRMSQLVSANGVGIELFEFAEPETERRPDVFEYWKTGVSHICVIARDIEKLAARIEATGGRMRTEGVREVYPGEPYRWCYCEDPFGTVIELHTHSQEQVYANRDAP